MFTALLLHLVFATLPPCPTEDSSSPTGCVWDASIRGNGTGTSFLSFSGPIRWWEVQK